MGFSFQEREQRQTLIRYFNELESIENYNSGLIKTIIQNALGFLEENSNIDFSSCFVSVSLTLIKILQFEIYKGNIEVRNLVLFLLAKSKFPFVPGENLFQESMINYFFNLLNEPNDYQVQIAIITILIDVLKKSKYSQSLLSKDNISIMTNLSISYLPVSRLLYSLLKSMTDRELKSTICCRISQLVFFIWNKISESILEQVEEAYYSIKSLLMIFQIKNSDVEVSCDGNFIKEIFSLVPESFKEKSIKKLLLISILLIGYVELDSDLINYLLKFMTSNDEDILYNSIISLKNIMESNHIENITMTKIIASRSQFINNITKHYFKETNKQSLRKCAIEVFYYIVIDTPNEITNSTIDFLLDSLYLGSPQVLSLLEVILQYRISENTADDILNKLINLENKEDIEQMDPSYQSSLNDFFDKINEITSDE